MVTALGLAWADDFAGGAVVPATGCGEHPANANKTIKIVTVAMLKASSTMIVSAEEPLSVAIGDDN